MYREPLPDQCPPSSAVAPNGLAVYRAVRSNPPLLDDFDSQVKLKTIDLTNRPAEFVCRASACSVFTDITGAKQLKKLPKLRDRIYVACLQLSADAGVIVKKGHHVDWWIFSDST